MELQPYYEHGNPKVTMVPLFLDQPYPREEWRGNVYNLCAKAAKIFHDAGMDTGKVTVEMRDPKLGMWNLYFDMHGWFTGGEEVGGILIKEPSI